MRLDRSEVGLNLLEGRQIGYDLGYLFHCSGAVFCDGVGVMIVFRDLAARHIDVDEGAQAVIFAEVAARVFVARCTIAEVRDGFQTDKRGLPSIVPKAVRLLGCADCAGLTAVLMHDDLRLFAVGSEAGLDEVDLRFDHSEIVLCAALENKAATESGQIWNTRYVEEDVLRENVGEPCENLLGSPALALEVDDIGLHEDCASIAEGGHRFCGEGDVGKLFDLHSEAFGSGLQEVSVAGGTLRVQLEVFYAAVFQDDEFDVLAAYIDDDMGVVVEVERRFRVRACADQRDIGIQNIFENVFGIAGRADTENLTRCALRFDLHSKLLEDLDRVLNRITV